MPVAVPIRNGIGPIGPTEDIGKILSGDQQDDTELMEPMDVLLDTCWAVLSEIERMELVSGSTHFKTFLDKRNL
jgi:hypothetical protein